MNFNSKEFIWAFFSLVLVLVLHFFVTVGGIIGSLVFGIKLFAALAFIVNLCNAFGINIPLLNNLEDIKKDNKK